MPIETLWPYGRQGSSPICSNSAHPSLFWPSDIWQKATSWRCSSRKLFVHKRDLEPCQQFRTQITIQNHSYSPPNLQHWDEFRPRLWGLTKSFQQITPITWWRSSTPEQGKNRESAWCQFSRNPPSWEPSVCQALATLSGKVHVWQLHTLSQPQQHSSWGPSCSNLCWQTTWRNFNGDKIGLLCFVCPENTNH